MLERMLHTHEAYHRSVHPEERKYCYEYQVSLCYP